MDRQGNYPLPSLFFAGLLLFLSRLQAARQIKFRLHTEAAKRTFHTLFGKASVPHGDTLNATFSNLDPDQLAVLPASMVRILIRLRVLEGGRFLHRYYKIAIDGTGVYVFHERHCEHCLTKTHNGKTFYYHMVLEAKLVTSDGLALSVMSEFIENPNENPSKQDCEIKAFHRLAERLKKAFPNLPILLLLDGGFAEGPVFHVCRQNRWEYLIVLKDGDLPSVNQEFRNLLPLNMENTRTIRREGLTQHYSWINGISYHDTKGHVFALNVLECREKLAKENTHRWISSMEITPDNAVSLAKAGRDRWKIENQGFNTQKTLGFALEHPYSEDQAGMKVYYFLLQIAHTWVQLCERGRILKKAVPEGFGALKNIAFHFLEEWRNFSIAADEWEQLLTLRIQVRLDTS